MENASTPVNGAIATSDDVDVGNLVTPKRNAFKTLAPLVA